MVYEEVEEAQKDGSLAIWFIFTGIGVGGSEIIGLWSEVYHMFKGPLAAWHRHLKVEKRGKKRREYIIVV